MGSLISFKRSRRYKFSMNGNILGERFPLMEGLVKCGVGSGGGGPLDPLDPIVPPNPTIRAPTI